jgi:hypothetical protein
VRKARLVQIAWPEVQSVEEAKVEHGHARTKWIVIGAVAAAAAIAGGIMAARAHNEGAF